MTPEDDPPPDDAGIRGRGTADADVLVLALTAATAALFAWWWGEPDDPLRLSHAAVRWAWLSSWAWSVYAVGKNVGRGS